jgi:hypothetical protein
VIEVAQQVQNLSCQQGSSAAQIGKMSASVKHASYISSEICLTADSAFIDY